MATEKFDTDGALNSTEHKHSKSETHVKRELVSGKGNVEHIQRWVCEKCGDVVDEHRIETKWSKEMKDVEVDPDLPEYDPYPDLPDEVSCGKCSQMIPRTDVTEHRDCNVSGLYECEDCDRQYGVHTQLRGIINLFKLKYERDNLNDHERKMLAGFWKEEYR